MRSRCCSASRGSIHEEGGRRGAEEVLRRHRSSACVRRRSPSSGSKLDLTDRTTGEHQQEKEEQVHKKALESKSSDSVPLRNSTPTGKHILQDL
ncbi:hypothetical protein E2C01_080339 [Portunus trituberculatus]|uniref:Uncharacterized protein n=1 Tax=Portunus trituberculatus TaxID=210409 RepID=A0A5B7IY52_PORTR|nr:hypothetical protein [Portunus trituberculatus]